MHLFLETELRVYQVPSRCILLWMYDRLCPHHYGDVIMSAIASQITSLTIVYSAVYSDADQRKHQGSASLAFVRGIHRGPVNSPHKWPVTRKMFPFDDVIMTCWLGLEMVLLFTNDRWTRRSSKWVGTNIHELSGWLYSISITFNSLRPEVAYMLL